VSTPRINSNKQCIHSAGILLSGAYPEQKGKASYNPAPCLLTNEEIVTCLPNFKTRYY